MPAILVGNLAQTRQTWRGKSVRELFAEIVSTYPGYGEDRLRRKFREEAKDNDDYLDAIIDYAFDAAYRAHKTQATREPISAVSKATVAVKRAEELKAHAARVEHIKEQILLLNQEMPNGKRARFCTLDYMYRLGGAYRKVGKEGSTKLVGATYDEAAYREKLSGLT